MSGEVDASDRNFVKQREFAMHKFHESDQDIEATGLSNHWKEFILKDFIPFSVPASRFTNAEWKALTFSTKLKVCKESTAKAMKSIKEGKLPEDLCTDEPRKLFWAKVLEKHSGGDKGEEPVER